jgi:pyruvate,water dikinase
MSDLESFQTGEIMVTQMTQPTMVSMARKASAIVTDEGGITSHAAIIARELNIPCLVGCKIATKIFRTGDRIIVDTETAVCRREERTV